MFTKKTAYSVLLTIGVFQIVHATLDMTAATTEVGNMLRYLNQKKKLDRYNQYIDAVNGATNLEALKTAANNILDSGNAAAYQNYDMKDRIDKYESAFRRLLWDGGYNTQDINVDNIPLMGQLKALREVSSVVVGPPESTYVMPEY